VQRRTFLRTAAGAGIGAFAASRSSFAADADIVLTPGAPGPVINPHIYGHFIEHLGGVVYDGIWVGRDSKIPNVDGIRKQFIDDMKRIGAPNLRWPGGCFADGYHWRDGIGPADERPRTYNFWEPRMPKGVRATETNHFGIHEFMRSAGSWGPSPTSRRTWARAPPGSSTTGSSTATLRRARSRWPTSGRRTAPGSRSASSTGASGTNPGAAAGT
jgi:alpha-N-arabinofuranosidase